jgi:PIN domain nuclease of toxin-antitoxin system
VRREEGLDPSVDARRNLRLYGRIDRQKGLDTCLVSAISAWELTIKAAIGKLRMPPDLEGQLQASRFAPLPVTVAHAIAAGKLPRHHGGPFDRMLVAQASLESLTLLTSDARLGDYDVQIMIA